MTDVAKQIYEKLDELGLAYSVIEHAPVHTISDCLEGDRRLDALTAKNYFLCTKNRKNFYLCLVRPEARLNTSDVSRQAGSSRLSFAPEEMLEKLLRTHAGAVSPMGLLFDEENQVRLLVDNALFQAERLAFHPCDNTHTLAMRAQDFFHIFLPAVHHLPTEIEIHDVLK